MEIENKTAEGQETEAKKAAKDTAEKPTAAPEPEDLDGKPKKRSQEEIDKIISMAKKDRKKSVAAFNDDYKQSLDILKFKHGIDQWTPEEQQQRKDSKRPCLVINELPKHSQHVCGEMRKNKIQIKIRASGEGASQENANIRADHIKQIEYDSNAESIYDHGAKMAVDGGFGACRVLSRYTESDPFVQELYIENIHNPLSVKMDPDAKDQFFADGEFAFVDDFMPLDDAKKAYGEDVLDAYTLLEKDSTNAQDGWYDKEKFVFTEYYKKEYNKKVMCLLSDGSKMEKSEAKAYIAKLQASLDAAKAEQVSRRATAVAAGQPFAEQPDDGAGVPTILKTRTIEEPTIKWYKITGNDILEEGEWPGPLIPIAFMTGEYTNIGGKKYYNGMFRHAKDPQRMTNNAYTSMWEYISLMPKSPFLVSGPMVAGYENDYRDANQLNLPFLKFKPDKDFPGLTPQRLQPANPPAAIIGLFQSCKQDIKDALGQYNADVGDLGREMSGVAITKKQTPGDTATYTYPDNKAAWVGYVGKIINEAFPYFYDTEREIGLHDEAGKSSFTMINTTVGNALAAINKDPEKFAGMDKKALNRSLKKYGPGAKYHNVTEGKFKVFVSAGPAYETQRQEAADNILKIAALAGKMRPEDLYQLLSTMDFQGADKWAAMVAKRVPPGIIPPKEGEQPTAPMPPSPQMQVAMAKVQLEMQKAQVAKVQMQVQIARLRNELAKSEDGVTKKVLDMLDEMLTEHHPADLPEGLQAPQQTAAPMGGSNAV